MPYIGPNSLACSTKLFSNATNSIFGLRLNHLQVLGLQWGRMGLTRRDGFTFCVVVPQWGRGLRSNTRVIDAPKLFGIHLALSGLLCLGFGGFHLGSYPGFFVSDAFGLSGGLVVLAPDWTIRGFDAFNPSGVIAHHIAAGILCILGGAFHLS